MCEIILLPTLRYEVMVQSQVNKEGEKRKGQHRRRVAQQDTDAKGSKSEGSLMIVPMF